jgi:hypothetical protein
MKKFNALFGSFLVLLILEKISVVAFSKIVLSDKFLIGSWIDKTKRAKNNALEIFVENLSVRPFLIKKHTSS